MTWRGQWRMPCTWTKTLTTKHCPYTSTPQRYRLCAWSHTCSLLAAACKRLAHACGLQAQQHRIMELESLLSDSESRLAQAQGQQHVAQRSTEDVRQELENNAGRLPSLHLCCQHVTDLHATDGCFRAHTAVCALQSSSRCTTRSCLLRTTKSSSSRLSLMRYQRSSTEGETPSGCIACALHCVTYRSSCS